MGTTSKQLEEYIIPLDQLSASFKRRRYRIYRAKLAIDGKFGRFAFNNWAEPAKNDPLVITVKTEVVITEVKVWLPAVSTYVGNYDKMTVSISKDDGVKTH